MNSPAEPGPPDRDRETTETLARAYAHGQSQARNDLGLNAKRPNYKWVDEDAFAAAAIEQNARLVFQFHQLYARMLPDGEHVWRFGPGSDGSLSRQRVKPGIPPVADQLPDLAVPERPHGKCG